MSMSKASMSTPPKSTSKQRLSTPSSTSPLTPKSKKRRLDIEDERQGDLRDFFGSPGKGEGVYGRERERELGRGRGQVDLFLENKNGSGSPGARSTKGKEREVIDVIDVDVDLEDVDVGVDVDRVFEADLELAKRLSMQIVGTDDVTLPMEDGVRTQGFGKSKASDINTSYESNNLDTTTRTSPFPSSSHLSHQAHVQLTNDQPISLSTDPLFFPIDKCPWTPPSTRAPYAFLANALAQISQTNSRISILNILTNLLRILIAHDPTSVLPSCYLLSNALAPPYVRVELGLGYAIISRAVGHVSGLSNAALRKLYTRTGDPGDVAFEAKSSIRTLVPHPPLFIKSVYETLLKIATARGQGAVKQKQVLVEKLLLSAKGEESRYVVRTLAQHIRVGATRTSVLTAFARAVVLTRPRDAVDVDDDEEEGIDWNYMAHPELVAAVLPLSKKKTTTENDKARTEIIQKFSWAESIIKRVFVQHPNFDDLTAAVLRTGLKNLSEKVPLTVGIPLHNMLGSPTRSLDEVYERLDGLSFTAEFKYDGQRAQIHASITTGREPSVKIFSRHLEDMTEKYPDVCELVTLLLSRSNTTSFIMDAEIVAIDPNTAELRSFQELSNRPRKDVQLRDVKVVVCVFVFDLMYLDDQVLLEEPFRSRRDKLRSTFPPYVPDQVGIARFDHVDSIESEEGRGAVEAFWQKAVEGRSEGLMLKLLDAGVVLEEDTSKKSAITGTSRRKPLPATYEPDKRTSAWLKLKKDYVSGLGDSLDLVPIGAWHGNGRKAKWWSPILLGLWNEEASQFVGVCKCMSGFSDAFYTALNDRYPEGSPTCSRESLWNVETGGLRPRVYFKPQEIWEIRGADITLSPVSVAALGIISPDRGLSLRFPRFIRVREDKGLNDASTPEFLANLWRSQEGRGKAKGGADEGDLLDRDMSDEYGSEALSEDANGDL